MNIRKLPKNQQGMGHVLMILLVVVVIAVIAGVGYAVANKNKTTPSSNSSTNTSTTPPAASTSTSSSGTAYASCMTTYKDANICNFASNSTNFEKTSYKATLTESGGSSSGGTLTLENDGKGNTSLTTTSNGTTINSIELNGNTYVQTGGSGTWTEYPSGTAGAPTTNPTSSMNIGVGTNGITFKYIDTEACGSLTCYKYQVTDSSTPTTTQYVWFDKSKYQLQEWQASDPSSGTTDMKITYQAVNITAPSPVQQYSNPY